MKRVASCALVLALGLFFVPLPAFAAQHIVIDTDVGDTWVYGNSPNPNGTQEPNELTATGNSVTVNSGGKVDLSVICGYADSTSDNAAATGNSVTVNSGGTVGRSVYGGYARSDSGTATATGNSVTVNSGGAVRQNVYGGYAS
ncbi:MAG: hypothetical protein FWG71_10910, partial [Synergistaceae bacterium]|nr:hypothetical protein [Synergistaceae bacterium]